MNGELKLVPIYDAKAIINIWHWVEEGAEKILEHSEGDTSKERIFNEIVARQLLLWIAFLDGKYVGFFTTKIEQAAPMTNRYLTVVHLYAKPGLDEEVFVAGLNKLKEIATTDFGCEYLRFWSTRRGWERKLKGWEQGYVEYRTRILKERETK